MVTVFKNFNEVIEHKSISTILEEIKTGKYKHAIVYLRKSLNENKKEAKNDLNSLERHFIKEAKKYGLNPLAAEGVTFGLKFSCGLVKNCLNFAKRHHTSLLENEWYQSVWVKAEMLRRERDYIEGKL